LLFKSEREANKSMKRRIIAVFLFVFVLSGCAGVAIHDDLKVPVGTVE